MIITLKVITRIEGLKRKFLSQDSSKGNRHDKLLNISTGDLSKLSNNEEAEIV